MADVIRLPVGDAARRLLRPAAPLAALPRAGGTLDILIGGRPAVAWAQPRFVWTVIDASYVDVVAETGRFIRIEPDVLAMEVLARVVAYRPMILLAIVRPIPAIDAILGREAYGGPRPQPCDGLPNDGGAA